MLTHIVRHYLPNGKAYELKTWYTDGGRISNRRHDLQGQRSRDQSEPSWPNDVPVIRGRRGHTVSAEPGGHTSCLICF